MRPPARLALGIIALSACVGVASPRASAQGYAPGPRPAYVAPRAYYYVPQARPAVVAPAPTYTYVQPRTYYVQPRTYYAPAPRTGGLLRVRKYYDSSAYPYILVDPNNPHWTFDYNQWMAHNF
jgi:hypothetical protein